MPSVYVVRCNFTAPDKEAAWNAWYSGPKLKQMLANPGFLSCQRFKRAAGTGRDYLALWCLESPEALTTPEYKAQWGFSEWTPLVSDWSRDLFDGGPFPAEVFAVAPFAALYVASFDGMSDADANAARSAMAVPRGTIWLPVTGLDRHTPLIGLRPLSKRMTADYADPPAPPGVQQALYRPISPGERMTQKGID